MMVEELLEFFVTEVDADLLKRVEFEDLKAGDVEDAYVGDLLHGRVTQGLVALVYHNPEIQMQSDIIQDNEEARNCRSFLSPEGALVNGSGNAGHRVGRC